MKKNFGSCLPSGDVLLTLLISIFGNASGFQAWSIWRTKKLNEDPETEVASTQLCVPISVSENIVSCCHTFGSTESALLSLPLPWSPSPEASGYIFQGPDQSRLWAGLPKLGWWFSIESFSCYLLIWDKGPSFAHWSHESLLIYVDCSPVSPRIQSPVSCYAPLWFACDVQNFDPPEFVL